MKGWNATILAACRSSKDAEFRTGIGQRVDQAAAFGYVGEKQQQKCSANRLSEAPDRQLRMSELAGRVAMSASRISPREAYPTHLASVRRRVVDHFASLDLPELVAAFEAMRDSLKE